MTSSVVLRGLDGVLRRVLISDNRACVQHLRSIEVPDRLAEFVAPAVVARLVDRSPVGVVVCRQETPNDPGSVRFLWLNEAAKRATGPDSSGLPYEAFIGKTLREAFPSLMETEVPAKYQLALDTGAPQSIARLRFSPEGALPAVFDITAVGLGGDILAVFYENVTEAVALEEAREATMQDLRRSNEDLDEFAYVASHDLRAPLRDVSNLAAWIREDVGELPDASMRHLKLLQDRISGMETLLEELLDYSRAGRVVGDSEVFALSAAVDQAVALAGVPDRFAIERRGLEVELRGPRAPIEQVIRNLVSNAVKHHDNDEGRIVIEAQRRDDRWAEITVCDDGPGIPARFRSRVFQVFQTLGSSARSGSGVGLALVKKLVQRAGGHVEIRDAGDRGACISFTWPTTWTTPTTPLDSLD